MYYLQNSITPKDMFCPRCGSTVAGSEARCPTCRTLLGVADDARTLGVTRLSFSSARSEVDAPTLLPGVAVVSDMAAGGNGEDRDIGPLAPGRPFGARYHIIRLLGIGGMGAVYQAWDAELAVAVAIKVIRPEVMADPDAAAEVERRFKRELLLAREGTDKDVVRIHDLGEIDGIKYITMSYVDWTDLATILKRDGALPVATVVGIARQLVAGLVAAHAAGVVHRDLKPENIMIDSDGEAL